MTISLAEIAAFFQKGPVNIADLMAEYNNFRRMNVLPKSRLRDLFSHSISTDF